jgi:hypothetical protein
VKRIPGKKLPLTAAGVHALRDEYPCRVRVELLQIALPPVKAQCIMHGRQEPAWTSEVLRQARYGSPLVSPESPDVVDGTALVRFSVMSN